MTIQELIKLIEQWAIDRGLDKNGTVEGQLIKTAEEVAELIIGISKDDIDVIKDSIGDVFVTLVIGNMLDKKFDMYKLMESLDRRLLMEPIKIIDLVSFNIHYLNLILKNEAYSQFETWGLIEGLTVISDWYELDFVECVESAYNEIADRKGIVKNGTFVKEDDLI